MGRFLNPGNKAFQKTLKSEIYVDKTMLLAYTNKVMGSDMACICNSRPRRFGKSITANMLAAYYSRGCSSESLFQNFKIAKNSTFKQHLNQYNTIFLNMQEVLSRSKSIGDMLERIKKLVLRELLVEYPDVDYFDRTDLIESMQDIYGKYRCPFIIIIDEWDCMYRSMG